MDVPRTGGKQQGQGLHECKQYKPLLPSPLFHACKAINLLLFTHSGRHLQCLTISAPALTSHALLCCGRPSSTFTPCSPSWNCFRLLSSSLALQCSGLVRPACCCCKIHHRHARGASRPGNQRPCPWHSPHQLVQCSADGPLPLHCMCLRTMPDARSPVPWAPSPAPLLPPPSPASMAHHSGSVHNSAPIMPRVSRSKKAARDVMGLVSMRGADPVAG